MVNPIDTRPAPKPRRVMQMDVADLVILVAVFVLAVYGVIAGAAWLWRTLTCAA